MAVLGSTPGLIVAAGVGAAASVALEPAFEIPRQEAWSRNANRVLDPGTLARLVARGGVLLGKPDGSTPGSAYEEARRQGYTSDKLDRLVYLSQTFPGSGELDSLSNRVLITPAMVKEALTRAGLPPEWHQPVIDSFTDILSPGELAAAVHRGLVPDQGLLLGEQPAPPFNVEAYPVQDIDAIREAAGSGYDEKRLQVLVGLQGLPMGPHEAAQAYFRKIITHGDYIRAFNTSNMRNEWAEAILEQTRQLPTARDFFENALRGYHDLAWAQEQAKRHGMSEADSLVIYQNQGRPMNIHQITQALARGAEFKPEPGEIKDPFLASVVEGPLKPAYYDLALKLKYVYSVPFWWRSLLTAGAITPAEAEQLLLNIGNPPDFAKKITDTLSVSTTAPEKEDPYVVKAKGTTFTSLHKAYVRTGAPQSEVDPLLQALIPDDATRLAVFSLWDLERDAQSLTAAP